MDTDETPTKVTAQTLIDNDHKPIDDVPTSSELLERVDAFTEAFDVAGTEAKKRDLELITESIIPSMVQAKNTLAHLYKYVPADKSGIIGRLKNIVLGRLKNIVINVMERESMRQQKFNELSFQGIDTISRELKRLDEQLESLEKRLKRIEKSGEEK